MPEVAQTRTARAPTLHPDLAFPQPPVATVEPVSPAVAREPVAPAFDEAALRAREEAVAKREDDLDRWIAAHREQGAQLTDQGVEGLIVSEYAVRAYDAFAEHPNVTTDAERALRCTTIVVLVLRNGFPIVGTSVCSTPENYNADEGRKEARADALAKLWLCAEYGYRQRLMGLDAIAPPPEPVR